MKDFSNCDNQSANHLSFSSQGMHDDRRKSVNHGITGLDARTTLEHSLFAAFNTE